MWQEFESNVNYYYDDTDGKIIGQIHRFGTSTSVYTATVLSERIDQTLGQYVTRDYATKAVENWWNMEDKTMMLLDNAE
jgi:hypothetical protein